VAFHVHFDTRDRPSIPTRGSSLQVHAKFSRTALGASDPYDRVEASAAQFFGRSRHTGFITGFVGSALGSDLPVYDEFLVGGLFSLGGYADKQLRGKAAGGASVGYHYRLKSLPPGLGAGVYVGAIVDVANAWPSSDDVSLSDLHHGVSVIAGADTVAGPFFVAYGHGDGGHNGFYLTLGRSL
jgi:NTE family protein